MRRLLLILLILAGGCEYTEVDAHPDQLAGEAAFAEWHGQWVDVPVTWVSEFKLLGDRKGGLATPNCGDVYVVWHDDIASSGLAHELTHCLLLERYGELGIGHSREEWHDVGVTEPGTARVDPQAPLNVFMREYVGLY